MVGERCRGRSDRRGVDQGEARGRQALAVGHVGVVDRQRQLQVDALALRRQVQMASELVGLDAVGRAVVLHRAVRRPPGADGGEPRRLGWHRHGPPVVEQHRWQHRDPVEAVVRQGRGAGADRRADRDVPIVATQVDPTLLRPDLGEPRVDVEEDAHRRRRREILAPEVPRDVDQQGRVRQDRHDLIERRPHQRPVAGDQCAASGQPERRGDRTEPVDRAHRRVRVLARRELLDEPGVEAQTRQPDRPGRSHPGLAAVADLVRERAGDDRDRATRIDGHLSAPPRRTGSRQAGCPGRRCPRARSATHPSRSARPRRSRRAAAATRSTPR